MRAVPLTTEEEGVALLAGAWAGGQRGVLLMQSSGVGNCINMLSLTPDLPLSVPDAGDDARRVGRVQSLAGADGVDHGRRCSNWPGSRCCAPSHPGEVREVVEAAAGQAFNACTPTAVLLSQRLIGAKVFIK